VEARPVRVAATWQGKTLIESGLAPGDRVVVDGQYKLRVGTRVIDTAQSAPAKVTAAQP